MARTAEKALMLGSIDFALHHAVRGCASLDTPPFDFAQGKRRAQDRQGKQRPQNDTLRGEAERAKKGCAKLNKGGW